MSFDGQLRNRVGQRLKEARQALDLSQYAVSKKLGSSQKHISAIELGQKNTSFESIVRLCELYDISLDSLVYDTDEQFGELLNDLRGVVYEVRSVV